MHIQYIGGYGYAGNEIWVDRHLEGWLIGDEVSRDRERRDRERGVEGVSFFLLHFWVKEQAGIYRFEERKETAGFVERI